MKFRTRGKVLLLIILMAICAWGGARCGQQPVGVGGDGGGETTSERREQTTDAQINKVDLVLSRLRSRLAFNSPNRMQIDETKTITLALSPTDTAEELTQVVRQRGGESGPIESAEQIPTTQRMQARLTGKDFEIEALDSETMAVTSDAPTVWRWDVTPTKGGKKRLHLTVSALIKVQGESTYRTVTSFDRDIEVNVTVSQRLLRYASSAINAPSWLWTAILIPLATAAGGALIAWRRRKRQPTARDGRPPLPRNGP